MLVPPTTISTLMNFGLVVNIAVFTFMHIQASLCWKNKLKVILLYKYTSGFANTHIVVSVRHPFTYWSPHPLSYQPPKYVKDSYWREWNCRQYTCYFTANGSKNKTFCIPRGIIPQDFSSSGLVVSEELGNKHPNRQTNSLTFYYFYRVIV